VRLGGRDDGKRVRMSELVPLATMDDLVFAAWDISAENAYQVATRSAVLDRAHIEAVRPLLEALRPMPAVHHPETVRRLSPDNVMTAESRREQAETLREDIRRTLRETGANRGVAIFLASTETRQYPTPAHESASAFEAAIDRDDPAITPTQLYAYACLMEGIPFANGTPNLSLDLPALQEIARARNVPIAGKDLKTGQTMVKTVLAPALKARLLGLSGWFSTNILGNRDGEVLEDEEAFKSKQTTKLGVLDAILEPELYPELYGNLHHQVRINYYPPRGDAKEGWDNIDLFGWLGYPMQLKVNFLCRDSILAAPLVLDLVLFLDLASRSGWRGIQEWLSFYFKAPLCAGNVYPEHDLFIQLTKLKNTLRWLAGEELITHLGVEYYDGDLERPALESDDVVEPQEETT
jgi:myo-inositol-1-phosphate synthase